MIFSPPRPVLGRGGREERGASRRKKKEERECQDKKSNRKP